MRFIFRADASREIGSGHVMRSSVLAEEAISRGFECIFVGQILGLDWVSERIAGLGFSQIVADECFVKTDKQSDILVLDTYSMPVSNPFIDKKNWRLVLSIRDAITPKYKSDIELRPGLIAVHSKDETPMVLSGAKFALIRKGIQKSKKKKSLGEVTKVLVVGGGSDPLGFVAAIVGVINSMNLSLEVHAFTDGIITEHSRVQFVRYPIGANLDLIANDVDVVLTTASTSSFEFIAKEIPTGVVCSVDNQDEYYDQLGRLGYALQLGVYNSSGAWEFNLPLIEELLGSQERRQSLREAIHSLIDLKGAARVIDALLALDVTDNS
jgi:spore coat polysaccharide biosynthesis predicted glycosyltransferase SpsG